MNLKSLLTILGAIFLTGICSAIETQNLRCEYLKNPSGLDATSPRLSWIITSTQRSEKQTAYQILVASSAKLLAQDKGDLWDSGKVQSDENSQVVYAGAPLTSRQLCFWKVRTWGSNGQQSRWSHAAQWQMGLLQASDWQAKWITSEPVDAIPKGALSIQSAVYERVDGVGSVDVTAIVVKNVKGDHISLAINPDTMGCDPARDAGKWLRVDYKVGNRSYKKLVSDGGVLALPEAQVDNCYLRKSFNLSSKIQSAVLYATALGLYEIHINGNRVGDHLLAPDWTDYRKRIRYQAYDVASMLKQGDNAIGALLGNGWYSGHIGNGGNQFFGKVPALFTQLEITYADGHIERIVTDATWKTHRSPILAADFMMGEDYDARLEIKNWDMPGLEESAWVPATVRNETARPLEAQVMEPVHQFCEIKPKSVNEPKPGHWVYDLGQNMVGVVRLKIAAPAGTEVTLSHAEVLNADGTLYTKNLRGAPSVDHYTSKGGGIEVWQPRFTFHGFRYVEISGLTNKEAPGLDAVTGIVITSDTPKAGAFACSDARLNQLQSNIQWGQRGNYLSIPTDCPQRDERLGWMGDAQVFIRTATYNADVAAFFTKWLVDVDDAQSPAGAFSDVSPNTMKNCGVPGWGDAGVICPWTIYNVYGDKRILERHLPAMIKWVEFIHQGNPSNIRENGRGSDYGDWLSIGAETSKELIGTAYFAYSTRLLSKSCEALGRWDEAAKYEKLFKDIKAAFNKKYVAADGRIEGNTQCAYAMALKFDLLPETLRAKAARYLEEDIQAKGTHLSTGFMGVSYLLPVLAQEGKADTAYRLLQQDTFPSWLFSVKHGATTIWERWDGWTPEKGFQDPIMNSFNHYSLGSCGEYLFGSVGGIRPASPGYKTIRIEPVIRKGLTWARTHYNSIQGPIATFWKTTGARLTLDVEIPANTTAIICVPTTDIDTVTEGGKPAQLAKGVKFRGMEKEYALFEVGSGTYKFAAAHAR